MSDLKDKRLFLLDMDGTLYLDNDLFDGTIDFLEYVKQIGGKYLFLTNNSSKSVEAYIDKLEKLGIHSDKNDFLISTDVTISYLLDKHSGEKVYAFGTTSFKKQLSEAGINITDKLEDDISVLLCGYDTELTYRKLEDACILLGRGVDFIATNPDYVCPTYYGFAPDCGSVCDMLYNATKRRPKFIGKPEPEMALFAMKRMGFSKEETIILGDRIYTDIACGLNAKISTALMMSGETTYDVLNKSEQKPEFVFENIREFLNAIK